ncbi:hypothetical protein P6F26_16725 [Roseibacterium sp. SDUM158017]|uniref:hypothetical protein n=1 Tax=Roseicyclus salinarum TaxID=3036773 RepID=UPI00241537EA|nr:hypothetical protein [Roseibacterium sp. SDUM158017]MDG4650094.1 hypothetical protein [Roseibacterium sp. SDUM158017]
MSAVSKGSRVRVRHVPRERDDQVLQWLDLHLNKGVSMAEIARREGLAGWQTVQQALRPIIKEMEVGNA